MEWVYTKDVPPPLNKKVVALVYHNHCQDINTGVFELNKERCRVMFYCETGGYYDFKEVPCYFVIEKTPPVPEHVFIGADFSEHYLCKDCKFFKIKSQTCAKFNVPVLYDPLLFEKQNIGTPCGGSYFKVTKEASDRLTRQLNAFFEDYNGEENNR